MSHWQELIASALRVCELEAEGHGCAPGLRAAIARLRSAADAVRRRGAETFTVTSGYNPQAARPFIELAGPALPTTMAAGEARALALNLLAGADAAEGDAFLVEFFTRELGLELTDTAALLQRFRAHRAAADDRA